MAVQTRRNYEVLLSQTDIVGTADGDVDIPMPEESYLYPHNVMTIEFYSDAEGTTVVTPTAGTVVLQAKILGTSTFFNADNGSFQADAARVGSFLFNPTEARAQIAGIVGANYCRVTLIQNES